MVWRKADNWTALLPAGSESLVTLSGLLGDASLVAHPLGQLRVSQKVAPLGLQLERFGETAVQGAKRFDLVDARVGTTTLSGPRTTQEHFARGSFQELSDEQKLSTPSFESFDSGIAFSTDAYQVPSATTGDLSYETMYLEPASGRIPGRLVKAEVTLDRLQHDLLLMAAKSGAAAQSPGQQKARLRPAKTSRLEVSEPALAVVDALTMRPHNDVPLQGGAKSNRALAEQNVRGSKAPAALLVEAYELAS